MDLRSATSQLILSFETTNEFQKLITTANVIKRNPQQKQLLDQLNQLQKTLQSNNISEYDAQRIIQELNNKYSELSKNPDFANYFDAHEKFGRLVSAVIDDINKNLEAYIY